MNESEQKQKNTFAGVVGKVVLVLIFVPIGLIVLGQRLSGVPFFSPFIDWILHLFHR